MITPPTLPSAFVGMVTCCECGQLFAANDIVTLQGMSVCALCQPIAVQKIKEGVSMGTAMLKGSTWRDGKFVLTTDGACLPGRCVKCNAATEDKVKRKLFWHPPAYYLLVLVSLLLYVVVVLIIRRKATIEIGFCQKHRKRRMMDILLGWIGFLLGFVAMFGGFAYEIPVIGFTGMAMFVASIVYLIIRSIIVSPKRIEKDGGIWLKGACQEYLDSLPTMNQ